MDDKRPAAAPVRATVAPARGASLFQLPDQAVAVLSRSESGLNAVSAAVGVVAAGLISVGFTLLAVRGYRFAELFDLRGATGCVPLAITAMALWSAVWSILRAARVRALRAASAPDLVHAAVRFLDRHRGEAGATALLQSMPRRYDVSPVLARLGSVLRQWSLEPGLASADLVLQHHLYPDEERVAKAYTLMRTFVWAMPVLGLIGTVIGIARAVGGFASFLSGSVNDVEKIKVSLVAVTQGLSFAFMITMLGLVGALFSMLLISSLQSREERIIADSQKQITDTFLPALQKAVPTATAPAASAPQLVSDTWSQAVDQALSLLADRVREASTAATEESTRQIARLAEAMAAGQQRWLEGAAAVATSLTAEQRAIDARAEELRQALAGMLERSGELVASQQALAETVGRLERAGELTRVLRGVEEALNRVEPFLDRLSAPMVVTLVPEPSSDHGGSRGAR